MPVYVYKTEDGEQVEMFMSIADMERRQDRAGKIVLDDGRIGRRVWLARTQASSTWPQFSDAMACHPDQIKEFQAALAKQGVKTEFTSDGTAIIRSNRHRNEMMRALDLHDRDACYGQRSRTA